MDELVKIQILTALGIGSMLGYLVQYALNQKKELYNSLYKLNEDRYKNILSHMVIVLNEEYTKFMSHVDPRTGNQMSHDDHVDFLNAEYFQAILYAPDKVLEALKHFIEEPNEENFIHTARAMRHSLWNKKSKLEIDELKLANNALQRAAKRRR